MKPTVANDHSAESQDKPIVLVADDSRVMRVALTRILKEQYTVLEAEHGEDAWAKLMAEPEVKMVFSDLSMPQLDGFGLLGRIRGADQARIREVPFIVITGNEDDQTVRERAMANGATDFILKPFQSVEIKARAKAHVDHLRQLGAVAERLEQTSVQDELTGLANRRHFLQRAEEALAFAERQQLPLAVLQIQVDRYQALLHERGEAGAHEALTAVAGILRSRIRTEDTLAHFDDGLFVVLSVAADQVGAAQLAGRVAEAVSAVHGTGSAPGQMTVSVGIAVAAAGAKADVEDLLARAERLVGSAVRKGGNNVVAEDYIQAHSPAQPAKADTQATAKLNERLRAAEAELASERERAAAQAKELEAVRQNLVGVREELEAQRSAAKDDQDALAKARQEAQTFGLEVERLQGEMENLRFGASSAESTQAELQHNIDSLRAQLEEATTDLDQHRQQLESELSNRRAIESELAKLKLQEVARREAEQKAAEHAPTPAKGGGFGRLLARLRGRKSA